MTDRLDAAETTLFGRAQVVRVHLQLSHIDLDEALAERLGQDANHCWTAFGPTDVAVHRVSVAV